ncbi:MAG: hypothetical protein M1829_004295 [Trizodia sp. TS-e1964]|nr:MAG: hypothetical protein M1829_004295 [Trizodia sp. TS-e1964]
MTGPSSRKERKSAAATARISAINDHILGTSTLPLALPERGSPKGKTLFELADERKVLLRKGQPFRSGNTVESEISRLASDLNLESGNGEPIGPLGNALFFSLSLAMLHFTLDVLVQNQYRQEMDWGSIASRSLQSYPVMFFLIYMLHSPANHPAAQLLFVCMSITTGCYLVHIANKKGYYAVMKRAPPLGSLWVWSVIELKLPYAVGSLLVVLIFVYYGNYTII